MRKILLIPAVATALVLGGWGLGLSESQAGGWSVGIHTGYPGVSFGYSSGHHGYYSYHHGGPHGYHHGGYHGYHGYGGHGYHPRCYPPVYIPVPPPVVWPHCVHHGW
jgi:hypothetical protein